MKIDIDKLALTGEERAACTVPDTYILQEAAMCAWEHLLDNGTEMETLGGYGQARMCCASISEAIHYGYCIGNVGYKLDGYAYDFEFVPWFIDTCVILDEPAAFIHGEPRLTPDWVSMCRALDPFGKRPKPGPTAKELLEETLSILNLIPNQRGSYDLAAKISEHLK